jgi:hypothetical protein
MQFVRHLGAAVAILAAAMLLLTASQEHASAQTKHFGHGCAPGFTANAISPAANVQVCQSSLAVCPMRPGMNVLAQPLAPLDGQKGFALRYSCTYQPK